jgi:tripartite-type tricarboxylate transporter receptor subunit TctC
MAFTAIGTQSRTKRFRVAGLALLLVLLASCGDSSETDSGDDSSPGGTRSDGKLAKTADGYPSSPLVLRLPAAGAQTEALARGYAENGLQKMSPAQVRVDPLPSGSTNDAVISMLNDAGSKEGLVLSFITNSSIISAAAGQVPFKYDQLRGIGTVATFPLVIAVPDKSEFADLDDFVKAAAQDAGDIRVGLSSPAGGLHHLAAVQVNRAIGASGEFAIVPHNDAGEAVLTLLGGGVDAMVGSYASLGQYVEKGDVRVLASLGAERDKTNYPDVPTFKESGYDVVVQNQMFVVANSAIGDAEAQWLSDLFEKAADRQETKDGVLKLQWDPIHVDAAGTQTQMDQVYKEAQTLSKELGL